MLVTLNHRTFQNPNFNSRTFHDQTHFSGLSRSWKFWEKIQDFPEGVGALEWLQQYTDEAGCELRHQKCITKIENMRVLDKSQTSNTVCHVAMAASSSK